jgi:carbamoyltransferase
MSGRDEFAVTKNVTTLGLAQHLANGKVLGRVYGRMEFGARALGNRSILADPRYPSTIKKINSQIKRRDFWMPFTPSILSRDAPKYLLNPKSFRFPYMSIACGTTSEGKMALQAALHPADETARPQVVERHANAEYYDLISTFRDLTGIGALLNTSLNLHGYPIARSAKAGVDVFLNSHLDGIIVGPHLVMRK